MFHCMYVVFAAVYVWRGKVFRSPQRCSCVFVVRWSVGAWALSWFPHCYNECMLGVENSRVLCIGISPRGAILRGGIIRMCNPPGGSSPRANHTQTQVYTWRFDDVLFLSLGFFTKCSKCPLPLATHSLFLYRSVWWTALVFLKLFEHSLRLRHVIHFYWFFLCRIAFQKLVGPKHGIGARYVDSWSLKVTFLHSFR